MSFRDTDDRKTGTHASMNESFDSLNPLNWTRTFLSHHDIALLLYFSLLLPVLCSA